MIWSFYFSPLGQGHMYKQMFYDHHKQRRIPFFLCHLVEYVSNNYFSTTKSVLTLLFCASIKRIKRARSAANCRRGWRFCKSPGSTWQSLILTELQKRSRAFSISNVSSEGRLSWKAVKV